MTALDLGAADRVLTPPGAAFTSVPFGDLTFTASSTVTPSYFNGLPTIPLNDDGNELAASPNTAPQNTVTFIAVAGADDADTQNVWYAQSGGFDFAYSTTEIPYIQFPATGYQDNDQALPTALGAGITVWAIISNATEGRLMNSIDGTVGTVVGAQSDPGDAGTLYIGIGWGNTGTTPHHLLGIWQYHDVTVSTTDAADTMAAIITQIEASYPLPFSAAATAYAGGSAAFSVGYGDDDPDVPTLTPGGSATPPEVPAFTIPTGVEPTPIRHQWDRYPAPTYAADGSPVWTRTAYGNNGYAYMQWTVEGVDVTYWRGAPLAMPRMRDAEPFGFSFATLKFPQIRPDEALPEWAVEGANVTGLLVSIDDGTPLVTMFDGVVDRPGGVSDGEFTLQARGAMHAADLQVRPPSLDTTPKDLGKLVADVVNSVVSPRYSPMTPIVTGIQASVAGGWEPTMTGFVQRRLATAIKGGRQYTVHCEDRQPVLEFKDMTTVHFEVRYGQPGIQVELGADAAEASRAIYMDGTNPDGGYWRNAKYPNWHPDDTPAFPNADADDSLTVGRTDASTTSGNGVSVWQAKVGQPVTGVLSQGDRLVWRRIQADAEITVDNYLGPQTWAATFDTGANTGTLDGAFIAPLAALPQVNPRRLGPDGDDLGPNTAYDSDVLPRDRFINAGDGVWKSEGAANAREILARDADPGLAGSMRFEMDPEQMSRFAIRAGMNGMVRGYYGQDVLVHVATRDINEDGTVTAHVDSKARDYPTLEAIKRRDREAIDPAREAAQRLLSGSMASNRAVFDSESPAGKMPKHAIFGGLWDVRRMAAGKMGRFVHSRVTTSSPAQPFMMGVFDRPVTAADMIAVVGENPFDPGLVDNPWESDEVDALGLVMAWGQPNQPEGYYPKRFSTPAGETGNPVTGRMVDDASWEFMSQQSPWLWVATFAPGSCYVEADFRIAPVAL